MNKFDQKYFQLINCVRHSYMPRAPQKTAIVNIISSGLRGTSATRGTLAAMPTKEFTVKDKIFIIFIIVCFAFGCENCDSFPDKFNVNGITCMNYQIYRYDSTDVLLGSIISVNPIKYDSFALCVSSTYNTYYSQFNWLKKYLSVSNAFACSPSILSSNEIIESIYITSNLKWDNEHLAGDTLNDIIELIFYPIDSPIVLKLPIDLDTFTSQQPTAKQDYFLRFKSSPLIESNYSFKVYYKQKNGEIYFAESNPITIKP